MAYSELIKDFKRIRAYMRSFYVYGFRRRDEYDEKSARGYDDERRRVESWLGDYMAFRQDASGRRFFLSVDSRAVPHNPLYRAFRTKSFTDRDIMLHFHLMDILNEEGLSLSAIMEALAERLNAFEADDFPDESTVRRKLTECASLGLAVRARRGRETVWSRADDRVRLESWRDALDYFSEAAPLGVIGDFCRDKLEERPSLFRFKHHYILNALDSEILCALCEAISGRREALLTLREKDLTVLPRKIYVSVQTGRQYLLAWVPGDQDFAFFRLDGIQAVKPGAPADFPEELEDRLRLYTASVWGVSRGNGAARTRLEMTVYVGEGEEHIPRRLEREKRCGQVERLDARHWRYTAEVYDALEMLPWIRTFLGRITALECGDARVTERLREDMRAWAGMYGGDGNAVS